MKLNSIFRHTLTLLLAALLLTVQPLVGDSGMAYAFDAPPKDQGHTGSDPDGPDDENPDDPDQEEEGDPVQIATGNFKMMVEDAALDSFSLPISMQRLYNNQDTVNNGPFGRGWSTSFVMSIREVTKYAFVSSGGSTGGIPAIALGQEVVLRDDQGARHVFQEGPGDTWIPERARFGTLVKTGAGRFTWTRQDGVQFRFTSNRLDRIVDTNGNALVVTYDNAGRILTVTNPAGRSLTYAYNGASKIASITDNIGRTVTYGYSAENLLTTVTNQLGNTTTYGYDSSNRLNSITSADGTEVLTNTYDNQGRVVNQFAYGATFTYQYLNGYTRVQNSRNFFSDHYFNDNGNPIRVRDLRNENKYMTWDDAGNLLSIRNQRNFTSQFTYTDKGEVATITARDGGVTAYTYNALSRVTSVTDPLGRVTTIDYDSNGNQTRVVDPLGQEQTFTYDSAGRILTTTDEAGNVASYGYSAAGDLVTFTDENGLTTTMTYDGAGRMLTETNAAGETSVYTYNANNRTTTQTDPLGNTTTYTYNENDELVTATDPLGQIETIAYDGFGRVTTETDPLGNTTTFTYDSLANVVSVSDGEGRTTTRSYGPGNLVQSVSRDDGSTISYEYDGVANITTTTDPNGNATTYTYDSMDRPLVVTYADGSTMSRTYDILGRMVSMADRKGNVFAYAYDDLDRMTQITLPNDGVITYTYDSRDNLTSHNGYEGTVSYNYDPASRLLSETGVWGDVLNFSYDGANRIIQMDRPGRYTTSFAHDAASRLVGATAPSGTTTHSYDTDDRMVSTTMPNGVVVSYTYDAADRLLSTTHTAPDGTTALLRQSYTYDQSDLITSMTELDGTTHVYAYDGMLRLISEVITPGDGTAASVTTWTYDGNGNRLTQTRDGVTTTYTYNEVDELTTETGVTYSYDDNGNMVALVTGTTTESFSYDDLNRLSAITDSGAGTLTYGYDADGNRVRRTEAGTDVREVRAGSTLIEEKDVSGTPLTRFDYGSELTAVSGSFGTRHFMFDGIGGTRGLSDTTGALSDTYSFGAHGDTVIQTGTTNNPFVFNGAFGYYAEGQSDLYHVGARFYDAAQGRFVQPDPVRQGFNAYRHALDNPVNFNDPSGEIIPLLAICARGAASSLLFDEVEHHAFDGKEERTWRDRAVSAGIGCLTGGLGSKLRKLRRACSFDGDMNVVTSTGLVPIKDIDVATDLVLAKDEVTGELAYKPVEDLLTNTYEKTVRLTIASTDGTRLQTIVSNTIHPFFAVPGRARLLSVGHEGHFYEGDIPGGAWIDAENLRPGDLLLNAEGEWSELRKVAIVETPLDAYNISVADYSTYFITEDSAEDAVWVHNQKCRVKRKKGDSEHTKNKRPSSKGKHEKGRSRNKKDQGGEKGDKRRHY